MTGASNLGKRSSSDTPWPISWQRGLGYLVVFYVGIAVASPLVQMIKSDVAASDERIAKINRESEAALRNRDLSAMRDTTDRLEIEVRHLRVVRSIVFGGAVLTVGGLCLLILGTWHVTAQPVKSYETLGRYLAATPLILVLLVAVGIRTDATELLMMVVAIVISTTHEIAFCKIARKTQNADLVARLEWNSHALRGLLIVAVAALLLGSLHIVKEDLLSGIQWVVWFGGTVVALVEAGTFWQLRVRLRAFLHKGE